MELAEDGVEVGHEHEAPSADDGVERVRVELERLGVGLDEVDVVQTRRVDSLARYREHAGRHVDGDDASRRPDGAGCSQCGLAAAGRDIEHAIAGAHSCERDQPVVHRLRGALEGRPPSLPALGAVVPRGLLLALYFQIVGVLIAHNNYLRRTVTPRSRATTFG